ncbi:MAG TPA: tetratricopeptide repeat protein, partial [Terriglobia bacterium]|nr:tetratricopeptide repeat protein [Terriglobia bacterium]
MLRSRHHLCLRLTLVSGLLAPLGLSQHSPSSEAATVDALAREAQTALGREDWPTAVRGYEKLVKLVPGRADFHLNLGVARYSSGKASDAVAPLRQALKLKPDLITAQDYLAVSLAESSQCREALARLKKSAGRVSDPQLKRAVGLNGIRCSMGTGQPQEAVDFIRRLTRDFPHD